MAVGPTGKACIEIFEIGKYWLAHMRQMTKLSAWRPSWQKNMGVSLTREVTTPAGFSPNGMSMVLTMMARNNEPNKSLNGTGLRFASPSTLACR